MLAIRVITFLVGLLVVVLGLPVLFDIDFNVEGVGLSDAWRVVFLALGVLLGLAALVPRLWPDID